MASIRIPTALRSYADGQEKVEVAGPTVGAALQDLTTRYPDLKQHLYNDGQLRSFVNVFLGEEDIRYLDGADTALPEDAQLMIIPSIAGGSTRHAS